MKRREAIELLDKIANGGYYQVIWEGYEWYSTQLKPALKCAERYSDNYAPLLAEVWHTLGWTFAELEAPHKSIECYRWSIFYDKDHSESLRELADAMYRIGDYKAALVYISKARFIEPSDDFAIEMHEDIENALQYKETPYYEKDDLQWQCAELLAKENFQEVLQILKGRRKTEYLLFRARAYAALRKNQAFLHTLQRILANGNYFEWTYQDWFYLNATLYHSLPFWEILLQLIPLMTTESVFQSYQTLLSNHQGATANKIRKELLCRFHIYRLNHDVENILALHHEFPQWKELKDVANELMPPGMGSFGTGASSA